MREYPSDRVDLRSDTVTQPTADMRIAMQNAVVGDDVLGDDPTVIELQNKLAKMLGKKRRYLFPVARCLMHWQFVHTQSWR